MKTTRSVLRKDRAIQVPPYLLGNRNWVSFPHTLRCCRRLDEKRRWKDITCNTSKSPPQNRPGIPIRFAEVQLHSFFKLGDWWGWVVKATPQPLYPPRKRPDSRWIGGGVDTSPVWTVAENIPPPGIRSPAVHSVACPYTDWAIPAHRYHLFLWQKNWRCFTGTMQAACRAIFSGSTQSRVYSQQTTTAPHNAAVMTVAT